MDRRNFDGTNDGAERGFQDGDGGVDGMGIAHLKRGMWIADSRRYQASSVIGVIKSDG